MTGLPVNNENGSRSYDLLSQREWTGLPAAKHDKKWKKRRNFSIARRNIVFA